MSYSDDQNANDSLFASCAAVLRMCLPCINEDIHTHWPASDHPHEIAVDALYVVS